MDKLTAIETFVRVAEAGSFSAIAKERATSQSAVSKSVAALERALGTQLLSRTTRAIALTEEGQRYFERVRHLVAEIQDAELALKHGEQQLRGTLRVAASVGYGRKVLMPLIDAFLAAHPDVYIDLNLQDGFIDIVEQGIDVAIRIGELPDSSLLAKRVGTSYRALMASKDYVARVMPTIGVPRHPEEIAQHECVIYTGLPNRQIWEFTAADGTVTKVRVAGKFQTNSSEAVKAAGLRGMGLCYSPTWLFDDELQSGTMTLLLRDWPMRPLPIHAVYSPQRKNSRKVQALVAHLAHHLRST